MWVLDGEIGRGKMVGLAGFEPATPRPPVWCATKLRYSPTPVFRPGADYTRGDPSAQRRPDDVEGRISAAFALAADQGLQGFEFGQDRL